MDENTFRYSDTETYKKGYDFLHNDCEKIEDWGCGTGGFKRFFKESSNQYVGVDGSNTPFSNIKADLLKYTSTVDGIFMRHVMEHNYDWKIMFHNACRSFTKKMCLIIFTPFSSTDETVEIAHNLHHGVDVPDLSLSKRDLLEIIDTYGIKYTEETVYNNTGYGLEHIFLLEKIGEPTESFTV